MSWYVFQDGEAVSEALPDANACSGWLAARYGYSVQWAATHEGMHISEGKVVPLDPMVAGGMRAEMQERRKSQV